jgi:radical SAM/Cys-rich protein
MGLVQSRVAVIPEDFQRNRVAAACFAATGLLGVFLSFALSRRQAVKYELGSVDILSMTREAAKKLHRGERKVVNRSSLIPEVLQDLEDAGGTMAPDAVAPEEELDVRAKALAAVGAPPFRQYLKMKNARTLERGECKILQLNIGLYCNQACTHCHVESSPLRTEMSSEDVIDRILHLIRNSPAVHTLDITGGAPEMNRGFRRLIQGVVDIRKEGRELRVIDRCNLTVLLEPGYEDLAQYLADNRVDLICSLPSYDASQTDRQRGKNVFDRSMEGLRRLNALGYGSGGRRALKLDLVFNPPGPFLPPRQEALEVKYKEELWKEHGIRFDHLLTLSNMPVKRFHDHLRKTKMLEGYMDLLVRNFNPDTVPLLMCRDTVNVKYDGQIFDCDFNQQLDLRVGQNLTIFDLDSLDDARLRKAPIATRAHCYGCTAAQGSG